MSETQTIPCPNCEKPIHPNARFCRFCGHSMTKDQDKIGAKKEVTLRSAENSPPDESDGPNMGVIIGIGVAVLTALGASIAFLF